MLLVLQSNVCFFSNLFPTILFVSYAEGHIAHEMGE